MKAVSSLYSVNTWSSEKHKGEGDVRKADFDWGFCFPLGLNWYLRIWSRHNVNVTQKWKQKKSNGGPGGTNFFLIKWDSILGFPYET